MYKVEDELYQHHSSWEAVLSVSTNMKVALLTLSLVGCALAEAPPYPAAGTKPQGALLLLPPEYRQPTDSGSTFQGTEVEDLSKLSDKVMERLQQETGSDSGSYHVYLTDGRLQKVQYTTAPIKSEQQSSQQNFGVQDYTGSRQYSSQYNQRTEVDGSRKFLSEDSSNFAKLQQDHRQQNSQLNRQYSNEQYNQQQQNDQYNQITQYSQQQQQNEYSNQNGEYSSQYNQFNGQERSKVNPIIAQFGRLQQDLQQQQIQQLQQRQQQLEQEQQKLRDQQEQLRSGNYVASVQFSNVDPITSPIYSYKPSPVSRVLRYASQDF